MYRLLLSLIGLMVATMFFIETLRPLDYKQIEIVTNYNRLSKNAQKEVQCLAKNIYFEARNEPVEGQVAVAFVTLNRVKSSQFPNVICEVVEQRNLRICQFSWYCESKPYYIYSNNILTLTNNKEYNRIRDLALLVYVNHEMMKDPSRGSLYYHADYVSPNWRHLERVVTIGRHIFYNERNT
jgi:spore germination cell wall hydrolase CwlJ-like protein